MHQISHFKHQQLLTDFEQVNKSPSLDDSVWLPFYGFVTDPWDGALKS